MNKGIFSLVPEAHFNSLLQTLHSYTKLGVQLIDNEGCVLIGLGTPTNYCTCLNSLVSGERCTRTYTDAGKKSQTLGEAYVFTCPAELNHIAFAISNHNTLLCTVTVGPFLMDTPDGSFIADLAAKGDVSDKLQADLNDSLGEIPIIQPQQVNHLRRLVEHLLSPLLPAQLLLLIESQQKAHQQARINETIQVYKEQAVPANGTVYYEKEADLLEKLRSGSVEWADDALHRIMAYVHYAEGGRKDQLKMHALSLLSVLAMAAVDEGGSADIIYTLHKEYSAKISAEQSTDGPMFLLQEAMHGFISEMQSAPVASSSYVRDALRYMAANYSQPLTLNSVADAVGLSPNYLSSLFRKTVGVSFREQLCRIRVEESKRLLMSTGYSLTDIALAMGFNDQSYYCKVFKRITGLAPGQYRCR